MNWFTYAILASIIFSIYSVLIRFVLKKKGNPVAFTILSNFFVASSSLIFAFFTEFFIHLELIDYGYILLGSIFFAIASTLFITGRQREDVSVVSLIRELSVVFTFFIGITLFQEEITWLKSTGVFLLMLGTIVALFHKDTKSKGKSILILLGATIAMSISTSIGKHIVTESLSPAIYNAILFYLASLWVFLLSSNRISRIKAELKMHTFFIPLVSFLAALSMFLLYKGYQTGELSNVFPIYSSYVILTVIGGMIFLRERANVIQKVVGSLIALVGVILLS